MPTPGLRPHQVQGTGPARETRGSHSASLPHRPPQPYPVGLRKPPVLAMPQQHRNKRLRCTDELQSPAQHQSHIPTEHPGASSGALPTPTAVMPEHPEPDGSTRCGTGGDSAGWRAPKSEPRAGGSAVPGDPGILTFSLRLSSSLSKSCSLQEKSVGGQTTLCRQATRLRGRH